MGPHTIKALRRFKARYPLQAHHKILEVGAANWNGSIRKEFDGFDYTGYDQQEGQGVDVANPFDLTLPEVFLSKRFDLVLCCDVLEHTQKPWELVFDMARVLNSEGILFLLAPMAWPDHKCPIDCYRFLPDGLRYLAGRAGLDVLECYSFPSGSFLPAFDSLLSPIYWIRSKWLKLNEGPHVGHAHTVCIAKKP